MTGRWGAISQTSQHKHLINQADWKPVPRIVFLDLETTSLRHDRRFWEIGAIVRDPGVEDVEFHRFIDIDDLDLGNADPGSLRVGRFYDRHPEMVAPLALGEDWAIEERALFEIEALTRGAVIVGVNPGFDCQTLETRMRENGICPSWNYRLVDARTLAAGALRLPPPWKPEEIYESFGVSCPEELRHTAMGDARLARDLYDAVFAGERPAEAVKPCPCDQFCPDGERCDGLTTHEAVVLLNAEAKAAEQLADSAGEPGTVSGCACCGTDLPAATSG